MNANWNKATLLVLIAGLIFWAVRLRIQSIRKLNRRLEIEVAQRIKEKKALLEFSPVCTEKVDLNFNLQYMSSAGIKTLQIDDISLFYGKPYPFDFYPEYPEDFRNTMTKNLEKAKETGEIITQEASVVDVKGNELWFQSTLAPVKDDGGRMDYIIIVSIDITKRKQAEKELIKMEKLKSVGVLAGGIAHDFNNLLTIILGNIEMVKDKLSEDKRSYDQLSKASDACMRSKNLTQQLLTFSSGGSPIRKTLDFTKLIHESVGFSLTGSKAKCDFHISDNLHLINADEGQISQVIQNIIINAYQSMAQEGIIKLVAENIKIGDDKNLSLKNGDYIILTITDQGVGISEENLKRIFDPYFSTKDKFTQKGSGLGLAVCHSIIKKHDGCITVDSTIGVGTTISVYLPSFGEVNNEINDEDAKKSIAVFGDGKILVMDDEEFIRDYAGDILKMAGYAVESACDGQEAVELYQKAMECGEPFDAVILDLTVVGGMGGERTLKTILDIDPQVKAIVSSGYANDAVMADYKRYGFKGAIPKPYMMAGFREVVEEVLKT